MSDVIPLHSRHRAYLRAVRDGRAEMICGIHPDLYVDDLVCSDQVTAHELSDAGLISPAWEGKPGDRVRAVLTADGRAALAGGSGKNKPVQPSA